MKLCPLNIFGRIAADDSYEFTIQEVDGAARTFFVVIAKKLIWDATPHQMVGILAQELARGLVAMHEMKK